MLFPADWDGAAYIYRAASAAEFDPVVVAVRVLACAAPARRALRVQPTEALRQS